MMRTRRGNIFAATALSAMTLVGCHSDTQPPVPTVPPPPQAKDANTQAMRQTNPRAEMHFNAAPADVAPARDEVVATVAGRSITLSQLSKPLIEGYGLNVLLNIVQLELAKEYAAKATPPITVSPEDIAAERDSTLAKMFRDAGKDEYAQLLDQLLQQQHISRADFDLVIETNAYLRKLAEPLLKDKITDANLQEAFRTLYGETVQVRHIQCADLQEVAEIKRRLAAGEKFEDLAKTASRDARTAPLGGELPPFSRQAPGAPQLFKDVAFGLKEGEVSDPVQVEGAYHLIKLERRIPPKAVKFEDVKESLREDLTDKMMQATIKTMRADLQNETQRSLKILDPTLAAQYQQRVNDADKQIHDRGEINKQLERERQRLKNATSKPAAEGLRPPATQSAVAAPASAPAADVKSSASSSATKSTTRP